MQAAPGTPEKRAQLRQKAMRLPLQPGVYLMRDSKGGILYVGKAKALKNRVSQYFGSDRNHAEKVRRMVSQVEDFDYIITDSEFEALVLECSLIKQHSPKYNILLKDDKGYHYIKITKGPWAKITQAKGSELDDENAEYIGPFISSWAVRESVDEARKIFRLPSCSRQFPRDIGKGRPCLNYYIKQCCAPCRGGVKEADYRESVQEAVDFLRGGSTASVKLLTEKMNEAAEALEFERAARIRDRLAAIRKVTEKQKVVSAKVAEQDVIALAQGSDAQQRTVACAEVFRFRNGRLCDRETFLLGEINTLEQARGEFLERYYSMRQEIPPRVALDGEAEDLPLLEEWLSQQAGRRVNLTVPQRGEQAKLTEMCRNNAAEHLAQAAGRSGRETSALDELARLLGLREPPMRIEAYDISNLAGGENVAGMVVFQQGRPLKSDYRKFQIKGFEGQDDYASMREVLQRRLGEYVSHQERGDATGFGCLPDLILLDGGKGHVAAVRPVLEAFGLDVPLFGMVKDDKHRTRAITGDGGEISIHSHRRAFTLVSTIQDEVHRFAIGYHRQQRKKNTLSLELTQIPGIGKTRAAALFQYFRTLSSMREATVEELAAAPSMNQPAAQRVYAYFHPEESE